MMAPRLSDYYVDVPDTNQPSRNVCLAVAAFSGLTSVALFMFRPIPPVGLVAAIDLGAVSILFLFQALLPRRAKRWLSRMTAKIGKSKDDPNEPARWVP